MTKYEDEEHPYCKPPPTVVTEHQAQHQAKYQEHQAQLVDMKAEWSENFQDLSLFCNVGAANKMAAADSNTVNKNMMLQSGEQLDTPIITVNDEFDFGQRVSSRVSQQQQPLLLADASLDDTDPWADLQQHQPNNIPLPTTANNTKQWERVTDWLCSSPNHTIDYEPPTNSTFGDEDNFDDSAKLGLVGNNTGMEHDEKDAQTTHLGENLNPVLKQEQTIDIVELLKSSREPTQYIVNKVTVPVTNSNVNNSSRMQYSFAGKVVDSNRMQYTENKKEADTSSRMQYLLADNKVTDISNSYLGNRSRVVTIPNMEYAVNKPTDTSNRLEYQFNKAMDTSNSSSRKVLRNSLLLKNSNSSKNNRDPLIGENTNNLSSMFKAEEPLVVQTVSPPLLPRGRGGKNLKKPQLTLHTPHTGEVIEIGSASPTVRPEMIFGEEYMLPVDIKPEPEEEEEVAEEEEFEEQPPVVVQAPQKPGKKLKLDIRTANTLAALGGMGLTPSTAVLAESLDTPDVLKPLLEGMDGPSFDLIKFCEADELAHIPSPLVVESRKTIPAPLKTVPSAPKIAPSFGEKKEETTYERREPLSTIKEEDITTDESSSFHQLAARNSKTLPRKKIASTRKRRRTNFENYEVSENSSDNYLDNEDEDETFHLPPKTKYNQKSPSKRQRLSSKTLSIVSPAAKRKVSSSGIDSDQESIMSQDRYRELRDRNNEASKRSRMNRKSREMEMKEKANEMEKRNSYLKARAKRLDELVLTFREAIFKLVPKRL